jgi:4-diphosphocytidyl-2-C-methyl-D-erythritol kinase
VHFVVRYWPCWIVYPDSFPHAYFSHFHIAVLIAFPNCKINLGLQVLQKRGDGFHDIETIFYPVPVKDVLEIIPLPDADLPLVQVHGLLVSGEPADNLCVKAWQLLKKDFPGMRPVQIQLLKNIPMGAGLGGGSADAASMLQLLNNKFQLDLSPKQLIGYAAQLGSDCPFFVINQPCLATGRGEILKPIELDLSGYQLVLVHPDIHINTRWAFSQLNINSGLKKRDNIEAIAHLPLHTWKECLANDFEIPVFNKYPEIQSIKTGLYQMGALYTSLSGSGSTVFGIFDGAFNLAAVLPKHYRVIRL